RPSAPRLRRAAQGPQPAPARGALRPATRPHPAPGRGPRRARGWSDQQGDRRRARHPGEDRRAARDGDPAQDGSGEALRADHGLPPHAFVVQRKGPSLRQRAALFGRRHGLTPRQVEVLVALVDGRTNKEIAAALGIQEKTVELHVTAILRKTGAEKRSELITAFWNGR